MLSRQEEEQERRETLENDRLVRQQQKQQSEGTTFHQHAQAQADEINQGRFAATGAPNVIGAKSLVAAAYPAASPTWQIQLPDEPPLSAYENPALEDPTGALPVSPPVATDDPAHAPSGGSLVQQPSGGLVSERAGSSPSRQDQTKSRSD